MRAFVIAFVVVALFGCSKENSATGQTSGNEASSPRAASLTHQQALDKVYGNIHSNSIKESK
ncbi:hypothetical protein [Paraburkholderia sacchari]|uniref:hypothetical protein n=1 Tax=Paraburkholderia sacchari TaxID=159450 RepID=UPI000542ED0F|nr:hypothetical protein [Paraburkholderia sacchari]NLP65500.1 hypothetical protein [Paraburkholderia sacchari]NLP65585.1 hypothetical protein [Paraburkholderia sacchari]